MNGQKKKPPMTAKVKKLFAEWEDLTESHKVALLAEDYAAAREIGGEITAFIHLHQEDLKIPDTMIMQLTQMNEKLEANFQRDANAENEFKKAARRARQAENEYYQLLLEQTPRGREDTGH